MKLTSKCQVTVPKEVRERLGLGPDSEVEWTVEGDHAELRPRSTVDMDERRRAAQEWAAKYRGIWKTDQSTDEIMREIRGSD